MKVLWPLNSFTDNFSCRVFYFQPLLEICLSFSSSLWYMSCYFSRWNDCSLVSCFHVTQFCMTSNPPPIFPPFRWPTLYLLLYLMCSWTKTYELQEDKFLDVIPLRDLEYFWTELIQLYSLRLNSSILTRFWELKFVQPIPKEINGYNISSCFL